MLPRQGGGDSHRTTTTSIRGRCTDKKLGPYYAVPTLTDISLSYCTGKEVELFNVQ